jgi:hypothetical protein
MGKLKEIVIDADNPAKLARFWAQIVEGYAVRPYDDAEIARLAAIGLTPETDTTVMVDGPGPTLCFHLRGGPRPFRNRWHVDLSSGDRTAEVARVMALGARFWRSEGNYTTLRDPEGNPFCIIDATD